MTHKELISEMAQHLDFTQSKVSDLLDATVNVFNEKLSENTQISIQNFGVFETRKKSELISVNPQTKQRYLVPPSIVVIFKSTSSIKEQLKTVEGDGKIVAFPDLIDLLTKRADISNSESEVFLKSLFDTITETLSKDAMVKIKDFGTFKLAPIQARESTDVNSDEEIEISVRNRLSFSPAAALKELVNKPFSHFETILLNEGITFEGVEEEIEVEENEEDEIVSKSIIKELLSATEIMEESDFLKKIELIAKEESAISEEVELPLVEERANQEVFYLDKTPFTKSEKRSKIPPVWIPILGGVAIALASLFFFIQWEVEKKPITLTEKQLVKDSLPRNEIISVEKIIEEVPKSLEKIVLEKNKTLRLVAEEKFGNREFWVYIYLKNKNKIKNPNVVSVGTELIIPNSSEYDIDASNPQSIAKAKALGDSELEKF
ncbi:MAG: HU family DNA-binding protein [Bacteroidia bacterium]|nr:HU family DNA-binding protein [Bacteroidia bacterium]